MTSNAPEGGGDSIGTIDATPQAVPPGAPGSPISIVNNGPFVDHTDYWASPHAKAGYLYATWNAGALRLLVPALAEADVLAEIEPAKSVDCAYRVFEGRPALELVFDDELAGVYTILVDLQQTDRLIPVAEQEAGKEFRFIAYGESGRKSAELPGKWVAATLLKSA